MTTRPTLGPFQLRRPLGKGGMAMVWRAVHERHNESVAIKFMTGKHVRKERFLESFHREVRAVARMNHPHIVHIFDYGEIPPDVAEMSGGHIVDGSPYMVMELATSTLAHVDRNLLNWSHVHTILVHILDALAHAHARGMIHRDLKPDNVLLLSDNVSTRLKLSDFGVVYSINSIQALRAEDEVITGTPQYMAPEQIRGDRRGQGPWTDLYALGCLAYWLTSGTPPFSGDTIDEILRCHLLEERPQLEASLEVPDGFDGWVRRLLARDPSERFRRAADATSELTAIAGELSGGDLPLAASTNEGEAVDLTLRDNPDSTRVLNHLSGLKTSESGLETGPDEGGDTLPEMPESWSDHQPRVDAAEMVGVGLNLFELREIPLVGRHRHRDILWRNVADARDTARPHVVVLEGPVGIGKTRLATWLARRAHEVGAVEVLTAHHSPINGPGDGLRRMFANFLRCTGLSRSEIVERVRDYYGDGGGLDSDDLHQCIAVTNLIAPAATPDDDDTAIINFGNPEERYLVWKRLLDKISRRRPALVVLDDVHWGSDTLRFVRYLIDESQKEELSVCLVLTCRGDLLEDRSAAPELMSDIVERPCAQKLAIEPLEKEDHRSFVENLLCLEPGVAEQVARRTDGNPLFAIQLVGDWIERGILEVGAEGFRLADGPTPPLPEDIQSVLSKRLEKIAGHPMDAPAGDALLSLELAAALGQDVDDEEWRHLCSLRGSKPGGELLRRLALQSLIRRRQQGWSFANGAIRETLLAVASDNGRLRDHHRHCARMLRDLYDTSRDEFAPRLARHLLEAGELQEALDPLLRALRHYVNILDYDAAEQFYQLHRQTCRQLGIGDDHRSAICAKVEFARVHTLRPNPDKFEQILDECQKHVSSSNHPDLLADILLIRAGIACIRHRLDDALELAEAAQAHYERLGDDEGTGRCLGRRGWTLILQHDYQNAQILLEDAHRRFERLGDKHLVAECLYSLARVYLENEEPRRAIDSYRRVKEMHEDLGNHTKSANCLDGIGEAYRSMGKFQKAEQMYRRAIEMQWRTRGDVYVTLYFNLAVTLIQRRDFDAADEVLEKALESTEINVRLGFIYAGLAVCAANRADWVRFDDHFDEADRCFKDLSYTDYADRDLALVCETAGDLARGAGQLDRARRVLGEARQQWRVIGDEECVERVETTLEEIADSSGDSS